VSKAAAPVGPIIPNYVEPEQRTAMTFRPKTAVHRRLKLIAVKRGLPMQTILDAIVEAWLDSQPD
jgi:hypothetical protein